MDAAEDDNASYAREVVERRRQLLRSTAQLPPAQGFRLAAILAQRGGQAQQRLARRIERQAEQNLRR